MKIRMDFVSNSSSMSFMLVGTAFSYEDIKDAWLKLHPDSDEDSIMEMAEVISNQIGMTCRRGIDNYYDMVVIGLPYEDMKKDETKEQFEERIKNALQQAFSYAKVECCVDGGNDGCY